MLRGVIKKFLVASILVLSLVIFRPVSAQSDDQKLQDLSRRIEEYNAQIQKLQSQASTLSNEVASFDAKIHVTELKIESTQAQITLLGGRIDQLEVSLDSLNAAFGSRVSETYKLARLEDSPILFLASDNVGEAVSKFHYLQLIQEADNKLLARLDSAKTTYTEQKTELEGLEQVLGAQKEQLDVQKSAKANLLAVTKNDEKKYQQLLSEARAQLAALRRFVSSQGGASILQNQTKCDSWGCYYNQRDAEWGNIGLGGSNYSVAEYGCLISSISMIASHYGKNLKPIDIAVNPNYFVPGSGYLYHNASGMPFSISTASESILDSELAAGRPVIAGLFSGPDHFIVILRKEGDQYIMHDPFMPDGANRPLTDEYDVSDISSLRIVSFN